jgi:hypothetical protein
VLATAEAAAALAALGVRLNGHAPTEANVRSWCRKGILKAQKVGNIRRGMFLIEEAAIEAFAATRARKRAGDGTA